MEKINIIFNIINVLIIMGLVISNYKITERINKIEKGNKK